MVPGKVKIHMWRLIKNGLAVGEEMQRRHIKEGVRCLVCNRVESLMHRFWECPHSICVWEALRTLTGFAFVSPVENSVRPRELQGWLLDWMGQLSEKELSFGLMFIYQMWLARNEARDQDQIEDMQCNC
jgi:hypothetical protein